MIALLLASLVLQQPWSWTCFNTSSGLPNDHVERVVETRGKVWASTQAGLAWYDGTRWLPAAAELGLPASPAASLAVMPDGRVLAAFASGVYVGGAAGFTALFTVLPGEQREVKAAVGYGKDVLIQIHDAVNRRSEVWLSRDGILTLFPSPDRLAIWYEPSLYTTQNGAIFVNTVSGLYRWSDSEEWLLKVRAPAKYLWAVSDVVENDKGTGFAVVNAPNIAAGFWGWSKGSEAIEYRDHADDYVKALAMDPAGELLVAFDTRELRSFRQGEWVPWLHSPNFGDILHLSFRANGDVWVGTTNGLYLHRRSPAPWSYWKTSERGRSNRVNEVLAARDGSIWIATACGVEVCGEGGTRRAVPDPDGRVLEEITALAQDERGRIWIGSGSSPFGAYCYDDGRWQHFGRDEGLGALCIHKIRRDRQGRLWFLALADDTTQWQMDGPGAFCYDGATFEPWKQRGLPNGRVYAFCEGPDGALWFGTVAGLHRYQDGVWRSWTHVQGLRNNRIFALAIDHTGRLWFGHREAGLGYLDAEGSPRYLEKGDGLPNDSIWDLNVDERGWLWIATHEGLCIYRDGRFASLTREMGLASSNLWPVLALGERVYVGTLGQGLATLDLNQVDREPPVVDVRTRNDGNAVVLQWQPFGRWGFPPSAAIETRYRIDGGDWSPWRHTYEKTLQHPAPGEHLIEVEGKGLLGDVGDRPARQAFTVEQPFQRRTAFLAPLAALSLLVLLLGLVLWSRQRRHARQLRGSEQRYRDLFENAHDLIYTHDAAGHLTSLNQVAEQVLGNHAGLGTNLKALIVPAENDRVAQIWRHTLTHGTPAVYEMTISTAPGRKVLLEVSSRRMLQDGTPIGLQSVARDITERRGLEERLNQVQKMEAIGRLAGGVAHDFNNLLTAINGYSDLVLSALPSGSPAREPLEKIQRAGERAASLTKQLLALSRKQMLERHVLSLNEIITDLRELMSRLIGEDIELEIDLDRQLGQVLADPGQMQQVILNLAANARDAMVRGGELKVITRNVSLTSPWRHADGDLAPGAYVKLSVSDNGCGIDEQSRHRLFEPFYTTKGPGKGTGLGLSMVYGIVKQSDGHITVASTPGFGTTFDIYLPRVATAVAAPLAEPEPAACLKGSETLLIVEDEEDVRALMRETLAEREYVILEAGDGDQALELAAAYQGKIDLLVCDVVMPRMRGPDVAARLLLLRPQMKVLYVSGYAGDSRVVDGEQVRFIHKPFRAVDLARKIREVLDGEPRSVPSVAATVEAERVSETSP